MRPTLAGTRIRAKRRSLGLRQADVATKAGISASYLNLIEHNKRSASVNVLADIARVLGVPVKSLADGAESELVGELRQTAAQNLAQLPELDTVEEFIGRYPGWARITAAQQRQLRDQSAAISMLSDRQNYDPYLQETLHEMLTTITAIRSTSGILATEEDIEADQANRFQTIIHSESRRLSDAAQELVAYFDRAGETLEEGSTAQESFEVFLSKNQNVFPELETCGDMDDAIGRIIDRDLRGAATETIERAKQRLKTYARDAQAMPLDQTIKVAATNAFSPAILARHFNTDLHTVFRRLASLRRHGIDAPRFGLVIINAAGDPIFRRTLEGFSLPRFSSICALWPVFQALSQPGHALNDLIVLPNGREYLSRAIALPLGEPEFDIKPAYTSAMIVTSLNDAYKYGMIARADRLAARDVGTSCRLCQRKECLSRSEPSILPSV